MSNSTLASLDMSFNIIRATGAAAFGEALKTNSAVTWLDMSGNELGSIGGDAIAVSLETNSTLTSLDIRWNFVGARAFADMLKTNITLISLNVFTCTGEIDTPSNNEIDSRLGTNNAAKPLLLPAAMAFKELPISSGGQLPLELGNLIVRQMLMPGHNEGRGLQGVKSLVIANDIVKQRQCDGTG